MGIESRLKDLGEECDLTYEQVAELLRTTKQYY